MISADSAKKQSGVYGHVAKDLQAKMRTLSSEIELDGSRGVDTSAKTGALKDLEERMENAVSKQVGTVSKAADEMKEAVKEAGKNSGEEEEEEEEDAAFLKNIDVRL